MMLESEKKPEIREFPETRLIGKKYKNDDPNSEEEIWIPVKKKQAF